MNNPLEIVLKNGTPAEERMRTVLWKLCADYDLSGWMFTRSIVVDENAIPHSHPVLTVNVENEHDEQMALAELVHEQLHWFEEEHAEDRDRAIEETNLYYRSVPSARPEGAGDEMSTRLHLLVCYLEFQVLRLLLGEPAARQKIQALSRHHYCWVYRTVLTDEATLAQIVRKHDLLPELLRAAKGHGISSPTTRDGPV